MSPEPDVANVCTPWERLEEQEKLLAKSIPVHANIFFHFESTTEESLILTKVINECAKKILSMRNGVSIIEMIENKVMSARRCGTCVRVRGECGWTCGRT